MKKMTRFLLLIAVSVLPFAIAACGDDDDDSGGYESADDDTGDDDGGDDDDDRGFTLTSPEFGDGEAIPVRFTCDGANVSPPFVWEDPPAETAAFALAAIDIDTESGETPHWGLISIPADLSSLDEALSPGGDLPEGAWETLNYEDEVGYAGPCPPGGDLPHRYVFTLYALPEAIPDPGEETELSAVVPVLEEVQIGRSELAGTYDRD